MVKERTEPNFFSLMFGIILTTHSLALFVVFDIIEHGWMFFFMILIMLIAGGVDFFSEAEKILDSIYWAKT